MSCARARASASSTLRPSAASHSARDLCYFKGMCQAAAEVVGKAFRGQAGKDLRLAGQAAKGARVQHSGGVPRKWGAISVRRLGMHSFRQLTDYVSRNGNSRRQRSCRFRVERNHPVQPSLRSRELDCSGLVIPQVGGLRARDYSGLAWPTELSSLASLTRAPSSFFCTLSTSPGSISAGDDLANSSRESCHCAAASRIRPVFS